MLRTLLESQAVHARRMGGTLVSVGVHTGVIALAIVATARATSAPKEPNRSKAPTVVYTNPVIPDRPRSAGERPRGSPRDIGLRYAPIVVPPVIVPSGIPAIDAMQKPIEAGPIDWSSGILDARPARKGEPGGQGGPYSFTQVEKAVIARAGNPQPTYPSGLRSAQVQGSVVARFVVDTLGLAEPESITFPEATHQQFAEAVRQSLLHSRYVPAMVGDHHVRQLVEQRFAFTLTR